MSSVSWTLLTGAMPAPLRAWFDEVRARDLAVQGERTDLADDNLWMFGVEDEQRRALKVGDVSSFLRAIRIMWRDKLTLASSNEWMVYAWHDEMSGQLRFSACPARTIDELPFSCALRAVDVDDISREFVEGRSIIPYAELQAHINVPEEDPPEFILNVWAERL